MRGKHSKIKFSRKKTVFLALILAILILSIGYATINAIKVEIEGEVSVDSQEGVFITDVSNYETGFDASAEIKYYLGTLLQSTITLSSTNSNSYITEAVTVYNNSNRKYAFKGVVYDADLNCYSNSGIDYVISNFNVGEIINPQESKTIYIKFKYVNATLASSNVLDSYLNFSFSEIYMANEVEYTSIDPSVSNVTTVQGVVDYLFELRK